MGILDDIEAGKKARRKRLVLLLDPEKAHPERLSLRGAYLPDYLFVGGSTGGDTAANRLAYSAFPRACGTVYPYG